MGVRERKGEGGREDGLVMGVRERKGNGGRIREWSL